MTDIHKALPECIDRLARIEENQMSMKDNHLPHIYDELSELHDAIKKTQTFVVTQILLFGAVVIGALIQIILGG